MAKHFGPKPPFLGERPWLDLDMSLRKKELGREVSALGLGRVFPKKYRAQDTLAVREPNGLGWEA